MFCIIWAALAVCSQELNLLLLLMVTIKNLISIIRFFLLTIFLTCTSLLPAANYYWVGGSGNWQDLSHWAQSSGGNTFHTSLPDSLDNVFFDANSFNSSQDTVFVHGQNTAICRGMRWDNTAASGLYFTDFEYFSKITIYGDFELERNTFIDSDSPTSLQTFLELKADDEAIREIRMPGILNESLHISGEGKWRFVGDSLLIGSIGIRKFAEVLFEDVAIYTGSISVNYIAALANNDVARGEFLNCDITLGVHNLKYDESGELIYDIGEQAHFSCYMYPDDTDYFAESRLFAVAEFNYVTIGKINLMSYQRLDMEINTSNYTRLGLGAYNELRKLNLGASAKLYLGRVKVDSLILSPGSAYLFPDLDTSLLDKLIEVDYIEANGSCEAPILMESFFEYGPEDAPERPFSFQSANDQVMNGVLLKGIGFYNNDDDPTTSGSWTAYNSYDLGGSYNIDIASTPAPRTLYRLAGSDEWFDPAYWSLSSNGPGGECAPLPGDDVVFDAYSFNPGGQDTLRSRFALSAGRSLPFFCNKLRAETNTNAAYTIIHPELRLFDNWNLEGNMDFQIKWTRLLGEGVHSLTQNGANPLSITIEKGGSYSLEDAFMAGPQSRFRLEDGDFYSNGYPMRFGEIDISSPVRENSDVADFRNSRIDLTGIDRFPNTPRWVFRMDAQVGGGLPFDRVFLLEGAELVNHQDSGYLEMLSRVLDCSIISQDTAVETIIFQDELRAYNPVDLKKIDLAGDGKLLGNFAVDTLRFGPGSTQLFQTPRRTTVRHLFDAKGNSCAPITVAGWQPVNIAKIIIDTSAVLQADYLELGRVEGLPSGAAYAGPNSKVIDAGQSSDPSLGWLFGYQPDVAPFSLSPGFFGSDSIICFPDPPLLLQPKEDLAPSSLAYTYLWDNGEEGTSRSLNEPGAYELELTFADQSGRSCTMSDTFYLRVASMESRDWFPEYEVEEVSCPGGSDGSLVVFINDSINVYTLDGVAPDTAFSGYQNLSEGFYSLSVVGPLGCPLRDSVEIGGPIPLETDLADVINITAPEIAILRPRTFGGHLPYSYSWQALDTSLNASLSCFDCSSVSIDAIHSAYYTLTINDAKNCVYRDTFEIEVGYNRNIYLPNVFSPDYNGINDVIKPMGEAGLFTIHDFQVYDRWGALVYEARTLDASNPGAGWDGTINGKIAPAGNYLVTYLVSWPDGVKYREQGLVQLVR